MANPEHLAILKKGVIEWNTWREEHKDISPDLSEYTFSLEYISLKGINLENVSLEHTNFSFVDFGDANFASARIYKSNFSNSKFSNPIFKGASIVESTFAGANLPNADFSDVVTWKVDFSRIYARRIRFNNSILINTIFDHADISEADFSYSRLLEANLAFAKMDNSRIEKAILPKTNFFKAYLSGSVFNDSHLEGANLSQADLFDVKLQRASLCGALLINTSLVQTDFRESNLSNCHVYGVSAWDLILKDAIQNNLLITNYGMPHISVDNLEVAQFMYLLLTNKKIRYIIDTITTKVVLILGRFTKERKLVLDQIREELRKYNYIPILFDFDKPRNQSFIETVSTIAHMARFVIADMTDPKIVLEEVPHIVNTISVPVKPLLLKGEIEPVTLRDLRKNRHSLMDTYWYENPADILESLQREVIIPAEAKSFELRARDK